MDNYKKTTFKLTQRKSRKHRHGPVIPYLPVQNTDESKTERAAGFSHGGNVTRKYLASVKTFFLRRRSTGEFHFNCTYC